MYKNNPTTSTIIGIIFTLVGMGMILAAIPVVLISAYAKQAIRQQIQNTTFTSIKDLDYYRDYFEDISPGEISLIADLHIEDNKDITASILKLEDSGIIRLEEGRYIVNESKVANLSKSDHYLVDKLSTTGVKNEDEKVWKELVIQEALDKGLIKLKEKPVKFKMGCLTVLIAFIAVYVYMLKYPHLMEKLEKFDQQNLPIGRFMEELYADPQLLILSLLLLFSIFTLAYIFLFPLVVSFAVKGHLENYSKYERTEKGNEQAELVFGMKNFIHDFSNLSEADKKYLALWNDYLIYAVVLEENDKIIEEISSLRKNLKHENYKG